MWFREICLWKEEPQDWWEKEPGLMALYPLCRHNQELTQAVAHAATAIKNQEMDSLRRANLLTSLSIFGRLKDKTLDCESIIGREQMRESSLYQEIKQEGEQERARKFILEAVAMRFGEDAAEEFTEAVNRLENLEQLSELFKIAVKCRRVSQFRRALPTQ